MTYQIHEFFPVYKVVPHPTTGQPVSGGFTNEIGKSREIPNEVMNAVFKPNGSGFSSVSGYFEIPDTSPPQDDQVVLIAREIDEHCILAIANTQKDDGNRSFVGYRFFWLSKKDLIQESPPHIKQDSLDGVGTLLSFFISNKHLVYDVNLISRKHNLLSHNLDKICTKKDFSEQHLQTLENWLPKLTTIPSFFESNQDGNQLTSEQLHCLALEASSIHKCPIAWAWNVRNLSEPQNFTVIYCADKDALQKLSQPKLLPTPSHHNLSKHNQRQRTRSGNNSQSDNQLVQSSENTESGNSKNSRKAIDIFLFGAVCFLLGSWSRNFFPTQIVINPSGSLVPNPPVVLVAKTFDGDISHYQETKNEGERKTIKDNMTQKLSNFLQNLTNSSAEQEPDKFAKQETYAFTDIKKRFLPELPTSLNVSKKEDKEIAQSGLEATGFYQGTHYTPGNFTKVDVEAVKRLQKKYDSKYKTEIDGQVGSNTWKVLSKLWVNKQVKIAAHYLQQSFTIRDKDSDIKQDFDDLQSCKKKGSNNFIKCVNEKIDQKHFNPLPKQ